MQVAPKTQEEATNELRVAILNKKVEHYEFMKYMIEATDEDLKHMGHTKGLGEALISTMRQNIKEIEKMIRTHEKKFPD